MAGRLQTKVKHFLSISFLLYFVMACKPVRDTTDLFYYHTDSIQPGDIILRKSYGLISDIITSQLKDTVNISHCGILDKNEKGEFDIADVCNNEADKLIFRHPHNTSQT